MTADLTEEKLKLAGKGERDKLESRAGRQRVQAKSVHQGASQQQSFNLSSGIYSEDHQYNDIV